MCAASWWSGSSILCSLGGLDPVPSSTINELSDLRQVTSPLCTSFEWDELVSFLPPPRLLSCWET